MMTHKKTLLSGLVLVLSVSCSLVFGVQKVAALTPVSGTGYFSGTTVGADGDDVNSDVVGPRPAIPLYVYDGVGNDKNDYIAWLDTIVDQGTCASGRNEIGGAFIVNTMLGLPVGQRTKCVSVTMWNRVVDAIQNPTVSMKVDTYTAAQLTTIGGGKTSFYSTNAGGDNFYDNWSYVFSRDVVHFYNNSTGQQLYYIEVPCANPLPENPPGLPEEPQGAFFATDCSQITGWVIDMDTPTTSSRYYLTINGTKYGPYTTDLTSAYVNSTYGVTELHAFKDDPTSFAAYNPRISNTIQLTAVDTSSGQQTSVDSATVGPCVTSTCVPETTTGWPTTMNTGTAVNFTVRFQLNYPYGTPYATANPAIKVTIKDPAGGFVLNNATISHAPLANQNTPAAGALNSVNISFTPTMGGTYTMTYQLVGSGTSAGVTSPLCNGTAAASYNPFFQVNGGDVMAGSGIGNGSCVSNPAADIKSWNLGTAGGYSGAGSQVGAWATGNITNYVSGMGLNGGVAPGYKLSFANSGAGAPVYGGGFGATGVPCTPNYYAGSTTATGGAVGSGFSPSSVAGGVHSYTATGPFTLNGGVLAAGTTIDLYVDGDVFIQGTGITYAPYSLGAVPRFNLYVSGNIYISPTVTELHGVYVAQKNGAAGGTIVTCASSIGSLSELYDTCNNKLAFVGSVSAERQIIMNRTYGSLVAGPGVPAEAGESFSYGPELWLVPPATSDLRVQSYTNLAPVL